MSTKRPRSPSTSGDEGAPSSKRVASSTDDGDQEPAAEEAPVSPSQETSQVESSATQPDAEVALPNAQEQHTPPPGMMVLAPAIEAVHHSWEAFEDALKAYSKATYQLYVIRSTTSVKRRNLKISETANSSRASGDRTEAAEASETVEKTLIPEKFQWYSKSLKCTHGWKDRHRGTGKRGSGVVRSTSCPAKMCVTLQHRGAGPEDWQVVVTKHVRTHNHQLSKELYLYYSENRRIYDPDLLAVGAETLASGGVESTILDLSNEGEAGQLSSLIDQAASTQRPHILVAEHSGVPAPPFTISDRSGRAAKPLMSLSEASSSSFVIRPRSLAGTSSTTMPPPGAMVLTSGSMPARVMDGGGFRVPRVSVKAHVSWEAFHNYVSEYSFDTGQVFRTRSTVSVASRNAKALSAAVSKTGEDTHEVASYASYAATSPTARVIPEEFKWHSKLLICTYGWKRKSRSKASHFPGERSGDSDGEPCPAMLLARVERNVDGEWRVMINRQVQEHNHRLNANVEEADADSNQESMEPASLSESIMDTSPVETETAGTGRTDGSSFIQPEASLAEPRIERPPPLSMDQRDIVVRVPKMPSVFSSWDDFHGSLKSYSDSTFQLYRTRTTSSAKGRNQKIADMKRASGNDETVDNGESTSNRIDATRMIPESWRWYSKTLMCTHGWKERHRGTGKRAAHVVRSTSCPVKICATVQYVRQSTKLGNSSQTPGDTTTSFTSAEDGDRAPPGCWRVVVTKHVVDHNHNLSRELYQHYCENRRIYDPDLLTIDTSNEAAVIRRKVYRGLPESTDMTGDGAAQRTQPVGELPASQPPTLSTQIEVGLAETVSHDQVFGTNVESSMESVVQRIAGSVATSVGASQQAVPSVVLLPYSSAGSLLPGQIQSQTQQQQQEALIQAAFAGNSTGTLTRAGSTGGEGMTTLTTFATPGLAPANILLLNNAATVDTLPQAGTNVISISCRLHGSASRNTTNPSTTGNDTRDGANEDTPQCTCFRIAGGGNYVTIVPAAEPPTPVENSFDADDENMFYAEDMEGVWHPSSTVEIENVTTDTGETVWRVPHIGRRYPTWEAFHKYLDIYSAATYQLYRVRTTYSVRSRNVRLRQLAASRGLIVRNGVEGDSSAPVSEAEHEGHGLSRAHLVPEHYEWYSKTFLCTHGWKRRSRGSGQRVSHNTRATECPAKVCATLQRDGANKWSVVVTKHVPEHNHEVSETMYQQYCEVRRVRDPEVLAQAERLWRSGATRRRVFEFLKDHAQNHVILMKDVHNLVQRWQAQERRPTQAQLQAAQAEQAETEEHGLEHQRQAEQTSLSTVSAGHGDEGWLVNG